MDEDLQTVRKNIIIERNDTMFRVGDKVRVRKDLVVGHLYNNQSFEKEMGRARGRAFTVTEVDTWGTRTYHLKGMGKWHFSDEMLEPATISKIVITTDGRETLARLYEDNKVVRSAKAKCSPEDEFDFIKGAEIAFERLKEPEYYNGKVVAIKNGIDITKGKIYEVVDGQLRDDRGDLRPSHGKAKDFDELNARIYVVSLEKAFVEIVE